MINEAMCQVRVVFPAWEQTFEGETTQYPAFSRDYFLKVPIGMFDEGQSAIEEYFIKRFKAWQSDDRDFNGSIEFVQGAEHYTFIPGEAEVPRNARKVIGETLGEASSLFMSQEVKGTEIVMPSSELSELVDKAVRRLGGSE